MAPSEALPSSRQEAKRLGVRHYFTGKPCKHGHISKRHVCGTCLQCTIVHVRAYEKRYPDKHKTDTQKRLDRFYAAHPEWEIQRGKRYRTLNPISKRKAQLKWIAKNPQYHAKASRAWKLNNPERQRAKEHRRRAKMLGADGHFAAADLVDILNKQNGRCYWCCIKLRNPTIDHFIPLIRGGSNWPNNIRLACMNCNRSKNAMWPTDFAIRLLT